MLPLLLKYNDRASFYHHPELRCCIILYYLKSRNSHTRYLHVKIVQIKRRIPIIFYFIIIIIVVIFFRFFFLCEYSNIYSGIPLYFLHWLCGVKIEINWQFSSLSDVESGWMGDWIHKFYFFLFSIRINKNKRWSNVIRHDATEISAVIHFDWHEQFWTL